MQTTKIFTVNPIEIKAESFYPRNYDPIFIFVRDFLGNFGTLRDLLVSDVKGGSTPPAYFFYPQHETGVPFVKTSAIVRHFINTNDLYNINEDFHRTTIKRSITTPYDVIFSMTGKFMGKAALCPPTIEELNMSQNSVVLRTESPINSAFLTIFLNSQLNQTQIKGHYSITKQKYLNQGKIAKLNIIPYKSEYSNCLEDYLSAVANFYKSLSKINDIVNNFNQNELKIKEGITQESIAYTIKPDILSNKILLPPNYRADFLQTIDAFRQKFTKHTAISPKNVKKGHEIGSANYLFEGMPFIKTSDIVNYDVDYEPNYYCSEAIFNELSQDIKAGDILFTKDGKRGEVAVIQADANIVISSGLVKYRPQTVQNRTWLFLLLTSDFGKIFFERWFVIASTMAHLRKDFFQDFFIPEITEELQHKYIIPLTECFAIKEESIKQIYRAKDIFLDMIYSEYNIEH